MNSPDSRPGNWAEWSRGRARTSALLSLDSIVRDSRWIGCWDLATLECDLSLASESTFAFEDGCKFSSNCNSLLVAGCSFIDSKLKLLFVVVVVVVGCCFDAWAKWMSFDFGTNKLLFHSQTWLICTVYVMRLRGWVWWLIDCYVAIDGMGFWLTILSIGLTCFIWRSNWRRRIPIGLRVTCARCCLLLIARPPGWFVD